MRLSGRAKDALAWPRVLGYLAERTRTPLGRAEAGRLEPLPDPSAREGRRDRVIEMVACNESRGALPLDEVVAPGPFLQRLEVRAARLGGQEVYELIRLLAMAREVRRALGGLDPDAFPRLGADWSRFPDLDPLINRIEGKVTPAGLLEDHASPELHRLRGQIRSVSERLTRTLEGIVKGRHADKVLRDDYITIRNNRFVLPVRTDAPFPMEGIVHGTSGTAQTLFIEPLQTVSINNELVRLKDDEAREQDRILAEWSAALRDRREDIALTASLVGEYDLLGAMASFAVATRSVPAEVGVSDRIVLREARHPVLEATLADGPATADVVPLSLEMAEGDRVLVISGPNTGGKTVALKTVGLLALMAHAGLPVPAGEASFPEVREILVDIGDQQSIQSSLSTFSSHVSAIAAMVGRADAGSLVLLDEVGTGTDPAEGAALAVAVLDRLRRDGARVVATTHHGSVKLWAFNTGGVANAACEFDEESLRPTFHLLPGVAGASSGLAIAERLGLDPGVVGEARRRMDPGAAEAETSLARLGTLAAERAAAVKEARDEARRLAEARDRLENRAAEAERRRGERFAAELEKVVARFRDQSRRMLGRIRDARERKAAERERLRQEGELRQALHSALEAREEPAGGAERAPGWRPAVGERVRVLSLGKQGAVRSVSATEAEVLLGRTPFRVRLDDLRPLEEAAEEESAPRLPAGVTASLADRDEYPRELHLLGMRVDEALAAADKFLDDAVLAGAGEVRLIHGHGTGRLRKALRVMLNDHPHVESARPGRQEEGGDGATIARIRR